ncbi:unnamed protein product [Effrenium voratum]|uniref:Lipoprotein n=1 Tax=Effrenium voratum TaxID=2562239 RepID=A0AA36I0T8_9DINO|nr:unnamed protein product [Effrenium voratum]
MLACQLPGSKARGAMAVRSLQLGALALIVGCALVDAKVTSDEGKFCSAKSCDAEGHCEERGCSMLDGGAEASKPAAKGMIMSCQG